MSVFTEFRDFIARGNVVDLAVGVVIGGAFGKIVTSLVNDLVMPPIGLAMGGVDGFVGDGNLRQATEGVFEIFYSVNLLKAIWLTADYQFLWNPGYNADRGSTNIFGGRVHAEF